MGQLDRDWFHEDREKRDKIPHPGQQKKPDPQALLNSVSTLPDLTKGSFLTGFVVGFSISTILILLIILFNKYS